MNMIEVKTSELEGAALDWAVAKVELIETSFRYGRELVKVHDGGGIRLIESIRSIYSPSTDWSQGGPLVEKHGIHVGPDAGGHWWALTLCKVGHESGTSPLIAACRAIVASKLGDVVQVPADLIGDAA